MILQYPNEFLKKKCLELSKEDFDEDQIIPLFEKHVEAYKLKALGLAAIQIGLAARMIWIRGFGYLFNPKIVNKSDEKIGSIESCLSVQGKDEIYTVERHKSISVMYRDTAWKLKRKTFAGEQSIVVQHELMHLEGKCLPDYATKVKIKEEENV
jgi:peptide deformylase